MSKSGAKVVRALGFEPRNADSESGVLPLNYARVAETLAERAGVEPARPEVGQPAFQADAGANRLAFPWAPLVGLEPTHITG